MTINYIMLGAGGHAKVVFDAVKNLPGQFLGVVVPAAGLEQAAQYQAWQVLGSDEIILNYPPSEVQLINGIGGHPGDDLRQKIYEKWVAKGYTFASVVHPKAILTDHVELQAGVQVMAGAVLQPGAKIGENSLINTSASIDHDVVLDKHVIVSPGAVLCGAVKVASASYIGAAVVIAPNVQLGEKVIVGCGASVVRSIAAGQRVLPAAIRKELITS